MTDQGPGGVDKGLEIQENADQTSPARRLVASSATVSVFNGLGVVAGFALDALIAASFGVGTQTDAFFAAWRLPFLITVVFGMAASATLVPLFARGVAGGQESPLSETFSRIFNAVAILAALLSGLGILLSPWLVSTLFAGLPAPGQALAASLSQVLFLTVLFTGPVEVLRSLLYGHQIFALPTAINFARSTTAIVVFMAGSLLFPSLTESDWSGLHLLAWGFLAGAVVQLLVVTWQARRHTSLQWQPLFDLRHPTLRRTARLASAPTAGALVRQSITLAETAVASYLPPGSVTVLNYASRLTFVLSSVFLSSITTASMPVLSQDLAAGRREKVRQTLLTAMRLVTLLAIPLGIGLAALGVPVIRLLFERGRFDEQASQLTGTVLSLYAVSILFLGYFRVVQAYFYAAFKAGVVLILFIVLAVTTISLDIGLAGRIGVQGIAIGFTVGTLLTTILGLMLLWHEVYPDRSADRDRQRLVSLLVLNAKVAIASLLMALAALGVLRVLPDSSWALLPALALGGLVFLASAWLLQVQELGLAWDLIRQRGVRPE
ncbi:MAG: lipid II flippase MurJ [Chloroflexota bacterium]|nr:lipid II flippase MurJ [Chloroflexota bacterium]